MNEDVKAWLSIRCSRHRCLNNFCQICQSALIIVIPADSPLESNLLCVGNIARVVCFLLRFRIHFAQLFVQQLSHLQISFLICIPGIIVREQVGVIVRIESYITCFRNKAKINKLLSIIRQSVVPELLSVQSTYLFTDGHFHKMIMPFVLS